MAENKDKNKAEILLLSVAANIVSRHTSMVGVDKDRKDKIVGEMIQRDVPLMMSHRSAKKLLTNSAVWRVILFATVYKITACRLQDLLLQDTL